MAVVASVGAGVGRTAAAVRAIQTAISPRPRLAQAKYGIAVNGCVHAATWRRPSDSAYATARPVITWTPPSRAGRNSRAQRLRVVEHEVADAPAGVVGPLGGKDEGPALQRDAAAVGLHLLVGDDAADGHRQVQVDDVAGLPRRAETRA